MAESASLYSPSVALEDVVLTLSLTLTLTLSLTLILTLTSQT